MLSPPAKSELSLLCEYVSLSDGYVLFQEGNDSQFMYFVISGSVSEHRLEGQKKPMKPSKINLDRNRASLSKLSISNNVVCSTSGSIGNDKNLKKTDAGTKSSFPHPVGSPLRKKTQLIQLTHNTSISPPEFVDANTVSDLPPTLEEVSEVQGGSLQGELSNRRQEAGKSKLAKSVEASKRSAKRKNRIRPWMEADQAKRAEETKALAMVEVKRKKGVMRKLNRSVKSIVHGVRITAAIGRKTQEYGETLHVSAWGRNMSIKHVFGTAERLLNKGSFFGLSCDSIFQFGGADFDREYFETKIEQLLKSHIGEITHPFTCSKLYGI